MSFDKDSTIALYFPEMFLEYTEQDLCKIIQPIQINTELWSGFSYQSNEVLCIFTSSIGVYVNKKYILVPSYLLYSEIYKYLGIQEFKEV